MEVHVFKYKLFSTVPVFLYLLTVLAVTCSSASFDVRISNSADDAEENLADGEMYFTSTDLELGNDGATAQTVGIRFRSIPIPQNATIETAYLELETDEADSQNTLVTIKAEAADDASVFSSTHFDLTTRPTTTAHVVWDIPAWITPGEKHQSPDLSAIIQEVVNRDGWSVYNNMVFIINGSGERTAESFDGNPASAPLLHVSFSFSGNQEPVAVDDPASTDLNTPVTINTLGNDYDPDNDTLSIVSVTSGNNGSVIIHPDHTLSYTPEVDFRGKDTFTYDISDGVATDTGTITVTIGIPFVIHVVFDGFRPDAIGTIGETELPNVFHLINNGASTLNARADYDYTETLPNHSSMLTSRPVTGDYGNGVTFNTDNGSTMHVSAGEYVTSVFDVVHDNGLRTGLYASKSKFDYFDRTWNQINGKPDLVGADNGRDKIDVYYYNYNTSILTDIFINDMNTEPFHYIMISLRDPDSAGHAAGWMSSTYLEAVKTADSYLGQILNMVQTNPVLTGKTYIILTSDHGGTGTSHGTATLPQNYIVPFLVWGPGVDAATDLYTLNPFTRLDPGTTRPENTAVPKPIKNSDAANLATQLMGLSVIDGSLFNNAHDLTLVERIPGDVDGDGSVGLSDAIITLKIISNTELGDVELNLNADCNGDGRIGAEEAIYILTNM